MTVQIPNPDFTITHNETGEEALIGQDFLGGHKSFPLDADEFGFRYFDMEEENSKEYLKQFKKIGRWFSQIALRERHLVIKQWREMAVETDFEWLHDNFTSKLFDNDLEIKEISIVK